MARYRVELSGRVLEIGSRGDALTAVLDHHAADFTGIGFSPSEVTLCATTYPTARFLARDVIDLEEFEAGEFDAVVAGRYAVDHLADDRRRLLLRRLSRVVSDRGVLIFSTHNLACEWRVPAPLRFVRDRGYSQLNYSISRDAQEQQLQHSDFRLLECVDRSGDVITGGARADRERELHFVARPGAERLSWR